MALRQPSDERTIHRVEVRVDGEWIKHDFGRGVTPEQARERLLQMVESLTPGPLQSAMMRLREAFCSPRDRDGHRMAETGTGSVHDQPGPKGSPKAGIPPHSAE